VHSKLESKRGILNVGTATLKRFIPMKEKPLKFLIR